MESARNTCASHCRTAIPAFIALLLVGAVARAIDPPASETARVFGFTAPSRTAQLAPATPGRIAQFLVEEGAQVSAGQPLVRLEDELERTRLDVARLAAESTLEVELARITLAAAERELTRLIALGEQAATPKELSDARLAVESARLQVAIHERRSMSAQREFELARLALARRQILAPFPGRVVSHLKEAGESVEEPEAALVLAQLDPLEVVIDVALDTAVSVHSGDRVTAVADLESYGSRAGTVVFVSPVADGASRTRRVKVRVPNADGTWIGGLKVSVEFVARSALSSADGELRERVARN